MRWLVSILGGLIGIALLLSVMVAARTKPGVVLTIVLGLLFVVPLAWVFISALFPVVEDRNCPACSEWALEPLDAEDRYGVRCTACGHEDPSIPGARLGHEPPAKGVK